MRSLIFLVFFFSSNLIFCSSFSLRPAQAADMEKVYHLIYDLAALEGKDVNQLPVTKERLLEFGFGKHSFFSVEIAEVEGKIVGYALYFYGFSAWQGRPILYLEDLYVDGHYRKQGIGTALLHQLALYGQQYNCCRLEWHVFDWNDSAIAFYEKIGGQLRKDLLLVRLQLGS